MMQNINILSEEEVLAKGVDFGEDMCWSGISGQYVYTDPVEDGGEPFTGLLYERFKNGHIAYYNYYKNGVDHGEFVRFYESSKIKEYYIKRRGQIFGDYIQWYESGSVKSIEYRKYGLVVSYKKWDENGNLIDEKTEPDDFDKRMIEKHDSIGFNKEGEW